MSIVPHFGGRNDGGPVASDAGLSSAEAPASAVAPPSTNRGAQHTKASVDWWAGTFPVGMGLNDVLRHFEGRDPHGNKLEWEATERGAMGYRQGLVRGNIKVFYDGNADMGPHVVMSGQGCRQFEDEQGFMDEWDWRNWGAQVLKAGAEVTRFDTAFDDFGSKRDAVLTMDRVRQAVQEQRVVSRFKRAKLAGDVSLDGNGDSLSDVVYFGSIMSEMSVCIYDKAKEQVSQGNAVFGMAHWVRCELRAKKDRANLLFREFVGSGLEAVAAVLYSYLDFKEASSSDSNRWRWETCDWWAQFVGACSKLRLTINRVARTVEQVRHWLTHQVAPSLAMLLRVAGPGAIRMLLEDGKERLRPKHRAMLALAGVKL